MRNELDARTPPRDRADRDLRRGAADVDHGDVAVGRVVERAGRADEREPRLLLVAEDLDLDAGSLGDRARELLLVGGLADRGRRDRANRLACPSSRARRTCVATTSTTSRDLLAPGSCRRARRPLPIRVNARWRSSSRSRPSAGSATSSRVVFEPMSMQRADHGVQAIGSHAWQGSLWLLRHGDAEPHGAGRRFRAAADARAASVRPRAAGRALARLGVQLRARLHEPARASARHGAAWRAPSSASSRSCTSRSPGASTRDDAAELLAPHRGARRGAARRSRARPLGAGRGADRRRASR